MSENTTTISIREADPPAAPLSAARRTKARRGRDRVRAVTTWVSVGILAIVLGWLLVPGLFTSYDPLRSDPSQIFQPPGAAHWFGTDNLGRDLFARVVYGTAESLRTAGFALLLALTGGIVIGTVAAMGGRTADASAMTLVDVLLALPGFLLALVIVTALGPGLFSIAVGLGIGSIPTFARITRAEILRVRELEFTEASRISGASASATTLRHILPNSLGPVFAVGVVETGGMILGISALSYLGFGALPPTPEWGLLVSEGRAYMANAWWFTVFPGLVIMIVVTSLGTIGRRLLQARDI